MKRTRREFLGRVGGVVSAGVATAGCAAPARNDPVGERRFERLYESVSPAVLRVQTTAEQGRGQGSAFLYAARSTDDPYVVTNQHVVGESPEGVRLQYADGTWTNVDIVGTDPYSDLAVLEPGRTVETDPLTLRESVPDIGTEVLVVGSPLGLTGSATQGIISGRNRSIPSVGNFAIADAVQTDAALNPGNSGGPIVALDGTVIAIATARISGADNLGFGVSSPLARRVVPELIETGSYGHSYLGIGIREVDPETAETNDLPEAYGLYVVSVEPGGPSDGNLQGATDEAVRNGVSVPLGGDVVFGFDETPIRTQGALSRYLALNTSPGDTVAVHLWRDGRERTVELELGRRPDPN